MPFSTPSGLAKLETLKNKVKLISEKKDYKDQSDTSEYSKKMVESALFILNYIQENNNKSLGNELKKMVAELEQPISIIDNKKFTGIPAIFNTESLLLAKALRDFLDILNSKNDITRVLNIALGIAKFKLSKFLPQYLHEIDTNIQMYELFVKTNSIHKIFNQMKATIAIRINYYKNAKIPEDIDILKQNYEEFINSTLDKIKKLIPGNTFGSESVDEYYNKEKPYNIDTNNLRIIAITSLLYKQLINLEDAFNKRLNEKFPLEKPVSFFIDAMRELFTKEKVENYKSTVSQQLEALEKGINVYLTGKHLKFFQKIPAKKIQLINNVLTQIKTLKEAKNSYSSTCAFDIYKILVIEGIENLKFSKREKISPGKSKNLSEKYQSTLLNLAMDQSPGSDEEYYKSYCATIEQPLHVKLK